MNNPIKIFNEIFNSYLKYINSGLPFFREEYNNERNALIKEDINLNVYLIGFGNTNKHLLTASISNSNSSKSFLTRFIR